VGEKKREVGESNLAWGRLVRYLLMVQGLHYFLQIFALNKFPKKFYPLLSYFTKGGELLIGKEESINQGNINH